MHVLDYQGKMTAPSLGKNFVRSGKY